MRLINRHVALLGAVAIGLMLAAVVADLASVAHAAAAAHSFDLGHVALASPLLVSLRAKRTEILASMRGLVETAESEDRDLTAEEQTAFDGFKAEQGVLDKRIDRLAQLEDATALTPAREAAGRRNGIIHPPGDAAREFSSIGEFMAAVRFRPTDQRLSWVENVGANVDEEMRAELRMDDGASGGFAIPPQFRDVLLKLTPQQAIIRPRAQVLPAGTPPDAPVTMPALDQTGAAPGNWFGGVQVQWIGEGQTKPATDMKLREITLTPHEVAGVITITDKLLRNWQSAGAMLEQQLRGAIAQAEDFAFLTGNGVAKPLGIIRSGATYKVSRTTANSVTYDDIVEMMARCFGMGTFVYSRSVLPQLMKLRDPEGHYIWATSARDGEPNTLLGRPAVQSDRNPILGSLGDIWIADLGQYLIKDGSGPFVAASEHVLFQQNKTMIKVFWNVDGAPWLTAPLQLENGYVASPFVTLNVPSA